MAQSVQCVERITAVCAEAYCARRLRRVRRVQIVCGLIHGQAFLVGPGELFSDNTLRPKGHVSAPL